jgi:hypothetical protein
MKRSNTQGKTTSIPRPTATKPQFLECGGRALAAPAQSKTRQTIPSLIHEISYDIQY